MHERIGEEPRIASEQEALGAQPEPERNHLQETTERLGRVGALVPTEFEVTNRDLASLERKRSVVQAELMAILEAIPERGQTDVETEAHGLIRRLLSTAVRETLVYNDDYLTVDPSYRGNIVNRLTAAHRGITDALTVLRLLGSREVRPQ